MNKLVGHIAIGLMVALLGQTPVFAMSSTNYKIDWDNINAGGNELGSSTNYKLQDTLADTATGPSSSTNYQLRAGYRQADVTAAPYITFVLETQSNASQVTYSAFANGGLQVTVSSGTGFSPNDYIVVVENQGGSELIAIGKITTISTNDLNVDKWSGDNGTMSATPSGGDDYVYKLSGSSAVLGALTTTAIAAAVTMADVSTNAASGYTVKINEATNFISGANDINDVSDGTVTAGAEEYGIATRGDNATGSGDFAITGTLQNVASTGSAGDNKRTGVIYQAAISATTAAGSYSHTVTYSTTGTF